MQGLLTRSFRNFVLKTQGRAFWQQVQRSSGFEDCEPPAVAPDSPVELARLVTATARASGRGRDAVLQDLGRYMLTPPDGAFLLRQCRLSAADFPELLHVLPDMARRMQMFLPGLAWPALDVRQVQGTRFRLVLSGAEPDVASFVLGALRAVAEDYGASALFGLCGSSSDPVIVVDVLRPGRGHGAVPLSAPMARAG